MFAPIAIVGRACLVPGADSPAKLFELVRDTRCVLSDAPADRWRVPDAHVFGEGADRTWTRRGGYVDASIDLDGFAVPKDQLEGLDPLFHWVLDVGRRALADAKMEGNTRTGLTLGNLSLPSSLLSQYAEQTWLGPLAEHAGISLTDARNRFMSGLPAHIASQALGLGPAFALDAACASSLYAIELACRDLQAGRADAMLAGAVNRADDLFLHVGFCALGAMSRTGQSRPFHAGADGLVAGEGCGFVVLQRLDDAIRQGRTIHGVIRGVGLANDGRGRGILAPSASGQALAMRRALEQAELSGADVGYIECHATGTSVGDATELESMSHVYEGQPIGSLKGNIGHLVTAAGIAGLIKLTEALREETLPPTPHLDQPLGALNSSSFEALSEPRAWTRERRAGLSAFGFGGNDAHLIVETHDPTITVDMPATIQHEPVVVVSMGARVGNGQSLHDFESVLFDGTPMRAADTVRIPRNSLRFPPNDLQRAQSTQTMLLAAAIEATDSLQLPQDTAGVFIGYQCDAEIARWGARWRTESWGEALNSDAQWRDQTRDAFVAPLEAAHVVGTLPNMPANRISSQLDLHGPSYTVSAEELSGIRSLEIALDAVGRGDLDVALVGAVDLSNEPVHEAALRAIGSDASPSDMALVLVLMRKADAIAQGFEPLAEVERCDDGVVGMAPLGDAHAASGLAQVAAAVLSTSRAVRFGGEGWTEDERIVEVRTDALGGQDSAIRIIAQGRPSARSEAPAERPALEYPAHPSRVSIPTPSSTKTAMTHTMTPAPWLPPVTGAVPAPPAEPVVPAAPTAVAHVAPAAAPVAPVAAPVAPVAAPVAPVAVTPVAPGTTPFLAAFVEHQKRIGEIHRAFLEQQSALHRAFVQTTVQGTTMPVHAPVAVPHETAVPHEIATPHEITTPHEPAVHHETAVQPAVPVPVPVPVPAVERKTQFQTQREEQELPLAFRPSGPSFSREDLLIHASGQISTIFGELFQQQDGYAVQVRMPEPPLLLADRCTGMVAEPGSMKKGTCWTETDVRPDSWYLQHDGHMPAGIMIESGQADLFLISYLGADFANKGERAYRLLGCEMTWLGDLPKVGETLAYDIHVDGHANQGDVRLFFFHYDCWIKQADGTLRPALRVRHGQAGFFTRGELDDSAGILWTPEEQEIIEDARVDAPAIPVKKSFDRTDLDAFADGRPWECFGDAFERTKTHTRTPQIQKGRMLFLDEVTEFDPQGGPWKRGYLKGVSHIKPDTWYFDGHFKNDPCMPGTLMLEGCVQAMAFYLSAMGYTIDRDGWRFRPIEDEAYKLICRGQVLPESKELTYEIFVEEIHDGPEPTLYADLLCTVDGLGAFHARRFGLKLVPGWPLTSPQKLALTEEIAGDERAAIGVYEGKPFRFDQASLFACAWGQPSTAFGPMYERFDGTRRTPRLPGPPYHFLSRVTQVEGAMGELESDCEFEFEYDIPSDAWYFDENGARVMPFAVLLEAALQPCGWIASYTGSTLTSESDFLFRNLDGTGTIKAEVLPDSGTLRTVVRNKNISQSAGMIIVSYDVRVFLAAGDLPQGSAEAASPKGSRLVGGPVGFTPTGGGLDKPSQWKEVYELDTVFGFFPPSAFENQAGLPISTEQQALYDAPSNIDLQTRGYSPLIADPFLCMIDRVVYWDPKGGAEGLGSLRAEKDVDAGEWFFKSHFYQDPVQPGSLGIEAMLQAMQVHMLQAGMHEGMSAPRFEAIAVDREHVWKYRGQVVPENELISTTFEVVETGTDERGTYILADCSLWVDGKRIYEAKKLGMRLVDDPNAPKPRDKSEERLDPATDTWLLDHCPTHTLPALPMMSMVDRMMAAAREHGPCEGLMNLQVERWVVVDGPTRLKTEVEGDEVRLLVWRDANNPALSRFETVAKATIAAPTFAPIDSGSTQPAPNPYISDALFHGPAFQLLQSLEMGATGSRAVLQAKSDIPFGTLNQALLDAATHAIPHDALETWSDQIEPGQVGYPRKLDVRFYGDAPRSGEVICETQLLGFDNDDSRFPIVRIQLRVGDTVFADMRLTEILMPKGRLGTAPPSERRRFLRDGEYVQGVGLSRHEAGSTILHASDVRLSDWLPGTLKQAYALQTSNAIQEIAIKEHLGQALQTHPRTIDVQGGSAVYAGTPLVRHHVSIEGDEAVTVRSTNTELDVSPVRDFWREWFAVGEWPVEELDMALIETFVQNVHVIHPEAHRAIQGNAVLYLGNHQVGIESLLFSIIASALNKVPTLTLAKQEHRESWLGKLIAHCFTYPDVRDPGVITYFDRSDPASLPRIAGELAKAADARSLMVHVEGTRAHSCREPVKNMSGIFCDLAIRAGVPIVPVKFTGGLPVTPVEEKLEYPVGFGKQTYWLGAPILPGELEALPYKERTDRVRDAINELGPNPEDPSTPNEDLDWRAHEWSSHTHATDGQAGIWAVLETISNPSRAIEAVLVAGKTGQRPADAWLRGLVRVLGINV